MTVLILTRIHFLREMLRQTLSAAGISATTAGEGFSVGQAQACGSAFGAASPCERQAHA